MALSILTAVAALLVALCCPAAANPTTVADPAPARAPWPSCDLLYNWYWCRGHDEGGIICATSVKRGSIEPVAVLWTRSLQSSNKSHIPGQDEFGMIYNFINYAGQLKFTLRFCSKSDTTKTEPIEWHHEDPPPCKKNWYNCDLVDDRISCQLRLCPWSHEPLLPASGKVSDWYGCTKRGNQVDCYLSSLGERKSHPHTWKHVLYPEFHHEFLPHHEHPGMPPEFHGPMLEPIHELPPPPPPAWKH
ncbi:uncharacterized protein LOC124721247 [Schistocerca piceifrons]|uniref:uncharacterized protein LOC124721247 n=1 Tax=Schistocerca piceifrons TaxID=274613 RepID=UPI001F5F41DD|nr:uncharacterized protein LOC124721247 [Schistocerca piceifrons]